MLMTPLVSIIVPVYNMENVIGRCIDSILLQSFSDYELILINDGSTDKTKLVCDKYTNDNRVHCYSTINGGVSAARNYGLEKARGTWIMFVDGDDYIVPNLLTDLLSCQEADLIVSGVNFINMSSSSAPLYKQILSVTKDNRYLLDQEFTKLYFRTPWAKLFKRKIIEQQNLFFNTSLHIGEDTEFVFRYVGFIRHISFVPICGYVYAVDFYRQAYRHAMNAVDVHMHLDAILWSSGLRQLCNHIHYDFPLTNNFLKIYFRRLYFIYITSRITTYSDFKRENQAFNRLKLRYYSQSSFKELIVTFILRYFPWVAYIFLSRYRQG